jgi:hypothetical protein
VGGAFLRAGAPAAFLAAAGLVVVFFGAGACFLAGLRVAMRASLPATGGRVEPYRGAMLEKRMTNLVPSSTDEMSSI